MGEKNQSSPLFFFPLESLLYRETNNFSWLREFKISSVMIRLKIRLIKKKKIVFSGIIVGFGASMVRESASVMVGHYFRRRRHFVEMITMSGEGVGVALFSVILKEGVG